MADETKTTETKTETPVAPEAKPENYESPSFKDLLAQSRGEKSEDAPAPAETPAVEATPEVEAKPVVETPPAAAATPPAPAAPTEWENERRGFLAAISSLRAELRQVKQDGGYQDPTPAPPEAGSIEAEVAKLKAANQKQSLFYSRQLHTDFDDAWKAYESEVQTRAAQGDHTLYHQANDAELPYETAYSIGKQLLLSKKYGVEALSNPDVMRSAIEKEVRDAAYKEGFAAAEAKLGAIQREREKQPTSIGSGKAASGTESGEYRSPSFGELLNQVHKRTRANAQHNGNYHER